MHSCMCIYSFDRSVTSKGPFNKVHVCLLKEYSSIFEYIQEYPKNICVCVFFKIKKYIYQVCPIGQVHLPIMSIQDVFIPMSIFYDNYVARVVLSDVRKPFIGQNRQTVPDGGTIHR